MTTKNDWDNPFSSDLPNNGAFVTEGSSAIKPMEHPVPLESIRAITADDKRVINGPHNINQLAPFAYPWAWDDFLSAQDNHWTPRDIEMTPDISCYRSSPEFGSAEKHLFDTVFSQLVTFDVLAMRNINIALVEKITAPEIQNYLVRQSAEENIHVWTYQHIIETLSMDQLDIYSRYRTVPELYRKVQMTNDRLAAICDPYLDLTKRDNLDRFLMSYIFFACIFEGLFFYHGFTPIFSLQRRGLMTATGEQLQYIMRDEALHFQFGIKVVNQIMIEENYRPDPKSVQTMFEEAEAAERAYADHILPSNILGYCAEDHMEQFRFLANLRAKAIGYSEPFSGAKCTVPWLDEQTNLRKEKNFFERNVTEYRQSTSLSWG